ncbi:MAG: cytochrome c [Gemmatimonadota bacterium]|nr:cytochrome c [Gemmatimonadota bacterium]
MRRQVRTVIWTALSVTLPLGLRAQETPTPPQRALAGASVYGAKGCPSCHALNGVGGSAGPDLGRVQGAASVNGFVAAMWNHLPGMAARIRAAGVAPPVLTPWEAADLLAFLAWTNYLSPRGDTAAGRRLFTTKRCIVCHQVEGAGGVIGPALDDLRSRGSPIEMATALWNHAPAMEAEMARRGIRRPRLSGAEVNDLFAFLVSVAHTQRADPTYILPGNAEHGATVFSEKNCVSCHPVRGRGGTLGPDLAGRPQRSLAEFAAALWNKAPRMVATMRAQGVPVPRLETAEMADVVAYLAAQRYLAGGGSASRGPDRLREAGCLSCHALRGNGARLATDLTPGIRNRPHAAVIAALWNHVALPDTLVRRRWPVLSAGQVADIAAYFERQETGR